jgi:AraC family transcriptional regulator
MQRRPFETSVAKKFRLDRAPTLFAQRQTGFPIAFTHLKADGAFRGTSVAARLDEAFTFQIAMTPMPTGDIWVDGRHSKLQVQTGSSFIFDLTSNPIANLKPPFEFVRFYMPVRTMEELAYDQGLRRVGGLRASAVGVDDEVMLGLAMSLLPALRNPGVRNTLFLDGVALAFHAHAVQTYGGRLGRQMGAAGLAPWQMRRIEAYIEVHLGGDPSIAELARECCLSPSYFARAFRKSIGLPPHRWLLKMRVEKAKELLLMSELDIAQIAVACGFFDQSHLSRVFSRSEGCGPGRWQRLHRN